MMKNKQKGFVLGLIVVIIAALILGGIYFYEKKQISVTPSVPAVASWKVYTNIQFGYQIKYPSDWLVDGNPLAANLSSDSVFCP